jgi:periplasmic protein TonB
MPDLEPSDPTSPPALGGLHVVPPVTLEPVRRGRPRARLAVAAFGALAIHGAALGAVALMMGESRTGASGVLLDTIEIGLVDASVLAARPEVAPVKPAEASADAVKAADGAQQQAAVPVEAQPPPPEVKAEPLTAPTAPPEATDVLPPKSQTVSPAPPAVAPETRIETASIAAPPPAPPAPEGGVAARSDAAAAHAGRAAARASAGVATAYAKSVAQALGKSAPKGLGFAGLARVGFKVSAGGGSGDVRLIASSGHKMLDEAALAAVRRTAFAPPPAGLSPAELTFDVPYRFK